MAIIHASPMYKTYKELKPKLEEEKEKHGMTKMLEGLIEGKVEMVKNLLIKNIDINIIAESSGFTIKEINKIKKEMK